MPDKDGHRNISRQWWEWACLIEEEWKKGLEVSCQDLRLMGNYYICFDKPHGPKPPCLVYSFGIGNDFTFDDAMAEAGCQVFSFDPSMGVSDHQRSERVRFLSIGLSSFDSDHFVPLLDSYTMGADRTWRIRSLASLKKMLGHENKTLDVLKLDIETYEWTILKHLIKDGSLSYVKQLPMEWHIFPNDPMRTEFHSMYETYMDFKKMGFSVYYMKVTSRKLSRLYFNLQADIAYRNTLYQEPTK
ncbi:hypothetical protein BsWGS_05579 [Bradybaena similaris]